MKLRSLDWKYFLTFIITVLGVVVPLVWQSGVSKGLELRLRSSASLEPASQIRDLQLVLDGKKLDSPYSSTLELVNTGSTSVLSKDFDRPIEIQVSEGAQVITARVTGTSPGDIPVDVTVSDHIIRIAPYLSNAGDSISLSILSSGAKPTYIVRARIAGIPQVTFADLTRPSSPYIRYILPTLHGISAWALMVVCVLFMVAFWRGREMRVPRLISTFGVLAAYAGSTQLLSGMVEGFEIRNRWEVLVPIYAIGGLLGLFCSTAMLGRWYRFAGRADEPTHPTIMMKRTKISDLHVNN